MRSSVLRPVLALALLAGAVACGGDEPAPIEPPPGLSPISSREATPPPAAPGPGDEAPSGAAIQWALPEGWQATPPSSSMRMAQAEVPGPDGDAELTVFQFGPGGGGGVEANLQRWEGQMEGDAEPERGSFESGPFRVTWIAVAGTYQPGPMGTGPSEPQPGWRLLGAVVEGERGTWFFKVTGPASTVDAARDDFFALLRSVRPTG